MESQPPPQMPHTAAPWLPDLLSYLSHPSFMLVNGPLKESNHTTALKLFRGATSLPVELEQTLRGEGGPGGWPQGLQNLH